MDELTRELIEKNSLVDSLTGKIQMLGNKNNNLKFSLEKFSHKISEQEKFQIEINNYLSKINTLERDNIEYLNEIRYLHI